MKGIKEERKNVRMKVREIKNDITKHKKSDGMGEGTTAIKPLR
jgi:hypothetical protein